MGMIGWTDNIGLGEGVFSDLLDLGVFERIAGQVTTAGFSAPSLPRIRLEADAAQVPALGVTWEYFRVLRLPVHGRDFVQEDNEPRRPGRVAIISHALWQRAFGGRAEVIGTEVPASPVPLQIVGVAPPGFHGVRLGEQVDMWVPSNLRDVTIWHVVYAGMQPLARLRTGVTLQQAEQALDIFVPKRFPHASTRFTVVPISRVYGTAENPAVVVTPDRLLRLLVMMSAFVLAAGCATLAGLVLVHFARRRQEFAIRLALGCSRARLAAHLSGEMLGLFAMGCLGALIVASVGLRVLPAISLPDGIELGRLRFGLDWRVLAVALASSALTLAVATVLPLLRVTRPQLAAELAAVPRGGAVASSRSRALLLATQAALTVVLLVAAGLFTRTVVYSYHRGAGFDAARTIFVESRVKHSGLTTEGEQASRVLAVDALMDTINALPGVESVAMGRAPIGFGQAARAAFPGSHTIDGVERRLHLGVNLAAGPGYFEALGVPVTAGVWPDRSPDAPPIGQQIAVTASLARTLWPGEPPLGRPLWASSTVVAVVDDVAQGSVRLQNYQGVFRGRDTREIALGHTFDLVVRAHEPAATKAAVRKLVAETFPDAASLDVRTGLEILAQDAGRERLGALVFAGFGVVAWALSIAGVVGLVMQLIATRRRELGIRMALGATHPQLMQLAVGTGAWPMAAGTVAGLGAAALLSGVFSDFVVGVHRLDPVVYISAAAVVLVSALVAGFVPALRLRSLAPSEVLRDS